jgi:hypothetical protein
MVEERVNIMLQCFVRIEFYVLFNKQALLKICLLFVQITVINEVHQINRKKHTYGCTPPLYMVY